MSDGENLIDDYQLLNCISTGSATQIWEVTERGGGKHYAMKLLLPESFRDRSQVAVFKHEAKVAKLLDHPNLIRYHKHTVTRKHGYIIMEYFRAPNLKAQIGGDSIGVMVRFRKLIEGTALALAYMHEKGWVHKDVKPDNILFNKSSEVRLIDFSLAARSASGLSQMVGGKSRAVQGTRTYIAPETIQKKKPTPQTDMYSFGVTLFEALTGLVPFTGRSPNDLLKRHLSEPAPAPSRFNPNVTPEMDKFVLRMLSKKPENRHRHMNELLAEFRSLKVFKEDPQELARRQEEEERRKQKDSLDEVHRLDSRTDAQREKTGAGQSAGKKRPARSAQQQPAAATRPPNQQPPNQQPPNQQPPAQQPPAQQPPAQQPPAQQPPNQPVPPPPPGYPQMPPAYPHPGYAPPPQQPGYPPQGPPMGYPAMPPPGYAPGGPPMPGQPPPPPQPMPGPPAAPPDQATPPPGGSPGEAAQPQSGGGPPAPPQSPAQPSPDPGPAPEEPKPKRGEQKQQSDDDDLPYMDELPDVL